jgi:ABC-type transporter Mla subunit MlaD
VIERPLELDFPGVRTTMDGMGSLETGVRGLLLAAGVLVLGGACKETREGFQRDTQAVAESASETAAEAKQALQGEVSEFKAQTGEKLRELTTSISSLKSRTETGVDDSTSKLQRELDQVQSDLAKLGADGKAELSDAKQRLEARIAELGQKINASLDKAGDKVEETLD